MKLYSRFLTASALLAIAGIAATSCSNKEDDIFDDAAAVRMDAAKADTKALLISAPNGWELSYFADNEWEARLYHTHEIPQRRVGRNGRLQRMGGQRIHVAGPLRRAARDIALQDDFRRRPRAHIRHIQQDAPHILGAVQPPLGHIQP